MEVLKSLLKNKTLWPALILGVGIRLICLFSSIGNLGYHGGDAYKYIAIAEDLLKGIYLPNAILPPVYPAIIAPFLGLFHTLWPLGLINIILYVLFASWIFVRVNEKFSHRAAVICFYFLSIDPVWIAQTIIVGADFHGALFFGLILFCLLMSKENKSPVFHTIVGASLALDALIKPVYIYALPLFLFFYLKPLRLKSYLFCLLGWTLCFGPYIGYRYFNTGTFSISEHTTMNVGQYALGNILITKGITDNYEKSVELVQKDFSQVRLTESQLTWNRYMLGKIWTDKVIFMKIWAINIYKTVFGAPNLSFVRFFNGDVKDGPGIWIQFIRSHGLVDKIRNVNWLWILGLIVTLVEKLWMIILASIGSRKLCLEKDYGNLIGLWFLIIYFGISPFAFGDPRYFLPGTLALLYLTCYLRGENERVPTI